MRVYAAYCKDNEIRQNSSSGGIFTALGNYVIRNNGLVIGAKFNERFEVEYATAETYEDLYYLQKSKYVQSKLGPSVLKIIETELETGRMVLFVGTPCHVSAVQQYLKKEYDNLYSIDFICHGTPYPKAWHEYINFLEQTYHASVAKVDFRDKEDSWKNYSIKIEFDNGKIYRSGFNDDIYMQAFLSDLILSSGCYNCNYKGLKRNSDITIGDFWGIQNICPDMDDDNGTSIVFVQKEKGEALLKAIKPDLVFNEIEGDGYLKYNPSIMNPAQKHVFRDYCFKRLGKGRFDKIINACLHPNLFFKVIRKLKRSGVI